MPLRRWKLPEKSTAGEVKELARKTGHSELVCAVLLARGIFGSDEIDSIFSEANELDSPYTLIDMDKAAGRIREAIDSGERIAVYGDYDCDGITSTVLLTSYLQASGADVIYYVPDRGKEGYGLNKGAVDILYQQKTDLIVTVDNGISAHDEIAYANSLGMDVVVTDHHTPRKTLPDAVAVVDPHRSDCPSRFKDLAGVGVAFKLICALEEAEGSELLEYYSELAALGTIADIVPLVDENRVIAKHGLSRMAETGSPGIRALLDVAGLTEKELTGESAAFGIIPRVNATGRMGIADDAIELLLTDDENYAREIAETINEQNTARKKTEDDILAAIDKMIVKNPSLLTRRLFVAAGEGWHHGVVGIAAAKMLERYGKPVILFSLEGGMARGSGRSLEGFSLIQAVAACSAKLTQYGGHTLAAGMSIKAEDLPGFIEELEIWALENHPEMPVPSLRIDHIITTEELTVGSIQELSALEPFGAGNEAPVFFLPGLKIEGIYPTSDGKHVRIRLQYENHLFYAVYFGMSANALPFLAGDTVDVAAVVSVSEWNGAPQLSVRIKDIRPTGMDQEAVIGSYTRYAAHLRGEYAPDVRDALIPGREDTAAVYRTLKKLGSCRDDNEALYYRMITAGIDFCRMSISLDVLVEMGLIDRSAGIIKLVDGAPKVDLADSAILAELKTLD